MKPDFPSLADGIAEPYPDMIIKVAAFTVSEKSSNTGSTLCVQQLLLFYTFFLKYCNPLMP